MDDLEGSAHIAYAQSQNQSLASHTACNHTICQQSCVQAALSCTLPCAGGFKVGHLPTSPFEGVRNHSGPGTSASNSSGAPANGGPFGSRLVRTTTSMDTTNSNSGHHSANQSDQVGGFRGLTSSASQKERDRSPKGRESPFETMKHQQQVGQLCRAAALGVRCKAWLTSKQTQ